MSADATPTRRRRRRNSDIRRRPRRRRHRGLRRFGRWALLALAAYIGVSLAVAALVPPPSAVGMVTPPRPALDMRYLVDDSAVDASGQRVITQTIFDEVLAMIAGAETLVHVDMFLFNDWQGPEAETHRALADELADALIERRRATPDLIATLVTDPINTVYGGLASERLDALRAAGVSVVLTDLTRLQDGNRLWSGLWRVLIRPWGNETGGSLPNPLGPGKVSLRSWLALFNFKANHRKLIVADDAGGDLRALVTSANPHDGSSAHRNTALSFKGPAVRDLLAAERALMAMSGASDAVSRLDRVMNEGLSVVDDEPAAGPTVQILGERRIEVSALGMLGRAGAGDRVDLAMFYLADRDIVEALLAARARGADVRVLLDVNQDAFGRAKNGVPNRPVASELVAGDVAVRWCVTSGEQCHAKQLYVATPDDHALLLGSGNFTRRNLHDLNLEMNVRVDASGDDPLMQSVRTHFDVLWNNEAGLRYSSDYATHADESPWLTLQYRVMETTGLSTF